jgi:dTDP-4-dehydrorhamnose 3,5-epimerase
MKVARAQIPDVLIIEPGLFVDERGVFFESWNSRAFCSAVGHDVQFVQDNHSVSKRGVLRGLHYQISRPQGKLVRVVRGEVFDVAVDLRKSSPTFGRWVGSKLGEHDHRQMWVPAGFAHGFLVLSESADVLYKVTDYYEPADERCLVWNDPDVGIAWPLDGALILNERDRQGQALGNAETFA